MISFEKLLFLIIAPPVLTAEEYFQDEGFTLQDPIERYHLFWSKPGKTKKPEVITLIYDPSDPSIASYLFCNEESNTRILDEAVKKFSFKILENHPNKLLASKDFMLTSIQDEDSFSILLCSKNQRGNSYKVSASSPLVN